MIVGFLGKIGAGKDTAARVLIREYGFTQYNFAAPLKEEVCARLSRTCWAAIESRAALDPTLLAHLQTMDEAGTPKQDQLRHIVWDIKPPIIRELLQEYGTEVRRGDHPDYWVDAWKKAVKDYQRAYPFGDIVATDVRFLNEAQTIQDMHGTLIKVVRAEEESANLLSSLHQSEHFAQTFQRFHFLIAAPSGGVEFLQEQMRGLARQALHLQAQSQG